MTETQVKIIEKKLSPIVQEALELTIKNDSTMKYAVELLSKLNQWNDKITEEKEKVTKPLNEALKAERNRWKPTELQNQSAIDAIRLEMSRYQTEQVKMRKEAEEAIAAKIKPGKGNLSLDTAVKKIDELKVVNKEVSTNVGAVQFRETAFLKVIDLDSIPREYFDLNESAVLKALKEGKTVKGAEIEMKQVPVNYR